MKIAYMTRQQVLNRINKGYLLFHAEEVGWYFSQKERVLRMDANWLLNNKYIFLLKQKQNTVWPVLGQYIKTHLCPTKEHV